MTSLLFLDIDDVVCLNDPYTGFDALDAVRGRHERPDEVLAQLFAAPCVAALSNLHEALAGEVVYVISSSWRELYTRDEMCTALRRGALGFVADRLHQGANGAAWCTPIPLGARDRVGEIETWLALHHCREPFLILDDETSGAGLGAALRDRVHPWHERIILCDPSVGLHASQVPQGVAILQRPLQRPPRRVFSPAP